MAQQIKAGIIGGAGYTGGELVRLLLHHPLVHIQFIHSNSNAGNPIYAVHTDLLGDTNLTFTDQLDDNIDVLFLCLGHGDARKFLSANPFPASVKIIDMSNDFRLQGQHQLGERTFVYGLPELQKEAIQQASNIANPGCFATAIQLGLLPLAKAGLLDQVHTTGITGSTGAGQGLSTTSHFSWRTDNIQAYKTLTHQHGGEILQSLQQLQPSFLGKKAFHFVPWRGDFARGIFVSSSITVNESKAYMAQLYEAFYADAAFTHVITQPLHLKMVTNTNKCLIQLEQVEDQLVVHSAIDNLLKGAVGQGVQNMNLLFGLDEQEGLRLKPSAF